MKNPIHFLKGTRSLLFSAILFLLGSLAIAQAVEQGRLVGTLSGHKVSLNPDSGKEIRTPVKEVVPGDVIEYTLTYRNEDKTNAIRNLVIDAPIPAETAWVIHSAKTPQASHFEASIDGGKKYQKPPIFIQTRGPDGKDLRVEAPAERYTHLRWILAHSLEIGKEVSTTYRVRVK